MKALKRFCTPIDRTREPESPTTVELEKPLPNFLKMSNGKMGLSTTDQCEYIKISWASTSRVSYLLLKEAFSSLNGEEDYFDALNNDSQFLSDVQQTEPVFQLVQEEADDSVEWFDTNDTFFFGLFFHDHVAHLLILAVR